jgi:hypothetical protein
MNVRPNIGSLIQVLRERHLDVTGPTTAGNVPIYLVNGHTLTEDEIQFLAHEDRLTTWGIFSYVKIRAERGR